MYLTFLKSGMSLELKKFFTKKKLKSFSNQARVEYARLQL